MTRSEVKRSRFIRSEPVDREPWVDLLSNEELKDLKNEDYVAINQQRRQVAKLEFFKTAYDFLHDSQIQGDYFEFGCHRARTFRMVLSCAQFYGYHKSKFFAFDSFDGLPDIGKDTIKQWTPNALTTSEEDFRRLLEEDGFDLQRVETIKGFYSSSLTPVLSERFQMEGVKANLINVDCDYYASAKDVFNFIEPFLAHGTVIYLDDVFAGFSKNADGGVMNAFNEFSKVSSFHFNRFLDIGWWGRSFVVSEANTEYENWT